MNEILFVEIAKSDLDNLNLEISKGNYESQDFVKSVDRLSTTLSFLLQAIGEQNDYQTN